MTALAARILIATTALAVSLPAGAAVAAPAHHPNRTQRLQAALDGIVAAGSPGALLLDRHDGRTLRLTSGYADTATAAPMRATDRFRAASQMKSFTAVVVLQLVQEGRLGLDDPVDALLPGAVPHGWGRGLTVRHLPQNNSGLFDFGGDPMVNEDPQTLESAAVAGYLALLNRSFCER
jgi:D-alanyl-D-alanine carboxypeptidase